MGKRSCLYHWTTWQDDRPTNAAKKTSRGHMYCPHRQAITASDLHMCSGACTLSRTQGTEYQNRKYTHTHLRLGSLTMRKKGVWNESRACCTVGRLLTHAWTPASSHGPLLRAGQSSSRGWWKTISCIISRSELSLTGALQTETSSSTGSSFQQASSSYSCHPSRPKSSTYIYILK